MSTLQRFQLAHPRPTLGCDPEFFFLRGGKVVGAEKVLTPAKHTPKSPLGALNSTLHGLVIDGVQCELNPSASTCRETLAGGLTAAFRTLRDHLSTMGEVKASFSSVVEVSKDELDSLSDRAKVFGCAPSLNSYDKAASVTTDAATYLKRSAGGHIHMGLGAYPDLFTQRTALVPLFDILVGGVGVLLDRDPEAAERRKTYGRAGEHRLPAHGIEYRTLSNWWLRAYPLMSGVFGLARLAAGVQATPGAADALRSLVNQEKVVEAINTNNVDLAWENFEGIKTFLRDRVAPYSTHSLTSGTLPTFERFARGVQERGIEHYFPEDPLTHWCAGTAQRGGQGWEGFLTNFHHNFPS